MSAPSWCASGLLSADLPIAMVRKPIFFANCTNTYTQKNVNGKNDNFISALHIKPIQYYYVQSQKKITVMFLLNKSY